MFSDNAISHELSHSCAFYHKMSDDYLHIHFAMHRLIQSQLSYKLPVVLGYSFSLGISSYQPLNEMMIKQFTLVWKTHISIQRGRNYKAIF